MESAAISNDCSCGCAPRPAPTATAGGPIRVRAGRLVRVVPPTLVSIGIAFFPKCPLCWAAYMSVLGSIGITQLPPYQSWMLPGLVLLLLGHLYLLFRQLAAHRYWPFACSLLGAVCILLARMVSPQHSWLALVGIGALVTGSLLHTFPLTALSTAKNKPQPLL